MTALPDVAKPYQPIVIVIALIIVIAIIVMPYIVIIVLVKSHDIIMVGKSRRTRSFLETNRGSGQAESAIHAVATSRSGARDPSSMAGEWGGLTGNHRVTIG